jgi:hypothetical protein
VGARRFRVLRDRRQRDARAFDIYRADSKTYARTLFYENKEAYIRAGFG